MIFKCTFFKKSLDPGLTIDKMIINKVLIGKIHRCCKLSQCKIHSLVEAAVHKLAFCLFSLVFVKALLERTGYTLDVTTGQRKYGGPPPEEVYTGSQPAVGTEVRD